MGYGKNLKEAIDAKNMNVKQVSDLAGISSQTLYSIIKRDTSVRYDHAIRLSNVLDIDVSLICKENPYVEGEVLPELLPELNGLLTSINKDSYKKHRMNSILNLFEYKEFDIVDHLLCDFYVLDDDGRREIFDLLELQKIRHTDKDKKENLKKIK